MDLCGLEDFGRLLDAELAGDQARVEEREEGGTPAIIEGTYPESVPEQWRLRGPIDAATSAVVAPSSYARCERVRRAALRIRARALRLTALVVRPRSLPIIIAGSAGGYLKQGQFVNAGNVTNNRLYNTLATAAGVRRNGGPVEDFGGSGLTGGILDALIAS